jgi:hypothetical protein
VYALLAKLLSNSVPLFTAPIVGVVDNTLASGIEKIPDELLTAIKNLLA